jgi:hypothetical protein
MAATGHLHTKSSSIKVICGAGTLNLSAHGNNVDIEYTADELEALAYGDTVHTFLEGLTQFGMTITAWWAGSHGAAGTLTDEISTCLLSLIGQGGTCVPEVFFSPAGSTSGSITYNACVNVMAAPMSFPVDNIATQNITLKPRAGSMTAASYTWA